MRNGYPLPVLYYGQDAPPPERIPLRAGPLRMVFEPAEAFLRYVRLGPWEILRGVYAAVRDRNWGTVPPHLEHLEREIKEDRFRLTFGVMCRQAEIDFRWQGHLIGDPTGTIRFSFDGVAHSTFMRNRIGLCVLHPAEACAGQRCRVIHVDGRVTEGVFPVEVSPHQPFLEIRSIAHEVAPDLWVEVTFEGDVFEMEDQRNWTDASFKTYCTPLRLPFPVEVPEGTRIRQSVTLRLVGRVPDPLPPHERSLVFSIHPCRRTPLPAIGFGVARNTRPATGRALERLRRLRPAHLRVGVRPARPDWQERLRRAAEEAKPLGAGCEVAVFLTDRAQEELNALAEALLRLDISVHRVLVFHEAEKSTTRPWLLLARKIFGRRISIGGGTNAYFAELNRGRPPVDLVDLVCYSINPQVHAFDNASIVETLPAQGWTARSARSFVGDRPIAVTPVTLRPRFNPNATGPEPEPAPGELPPQVDVRQMSLLGAGWTLGSLKYLAESGAASVTYYETVGWRGVMETEEGPPLPERFRSLPGGVFPLYHVFADVAELAGGMVAPSVSTDPLRLDGVALVRDGTLRVLVANLTHEPSRPRIEGLPRHVRLRFLDERNALEAMANPEEYRAAPQEERPTEGGALEVELLPFALVRIDGVP